MRRTNVRAPVRRSGVMNRPMSRAGFLRGAGVAAVGAGAAIAGRRGSALTGAAIGKFPGIQKWKVGILHHKDGAVGSANYIVNLFADLGISYARVLDINNNFIPTLTATDGYNHAKELVEENGCNVLIGVVLSGTGGGINNYISDKHIPYVECYATSNSINQKYFSRTTTDSITWGRLGAELAGAGKPLLYVYENNGVIDAFSNDCLTGWKQIFPETEILKITQADEIERLPISTEPFIVGVAIGTADKAQKVMDYLKDKSQVSQRVLIGSHEARPWTDPINSTYNCGTNTIALQPWWDRTSMAYQRWENTYGEPVWDKDLRAYDAALLLSAAILASPTGLPTELHYRIATISTPPGAVILPEQFSKLNMLHAAVNTANYEGASGPCDIVNGECLTLPYNVYLNMSNVKQEQIFWS